MHKGGSLCSFLSPFCAFRLYSFCQWHTKVIFLFYCSCFFACSSSLRPSVSVFFTLSTCVWTQDGSRTKANERFWLERRRGGCGVLCWLDFSAVRWTRDSGGWWIQPIHCHDPGSCMLKHALFNEFPLLKYYSGLQKLDIFKGINMYIRCIYGFFFLLCYMSWVGLFLKEFPTVSYWNYLGVLLWYTRWFMFYIVVTPKDVFLHSRKKKQSHNT